MMDLGERIRRLLADTPTADPVDGRDLYRRGQQRKMNRWLMMGGVVVLVLSVGGAAMRATQTPEPQPAPVIADVPDSQEPTATRSSACAALADETAEFVVTLIDDVAARHGGVPVAPFAVAHPDDTDGWRLMVELARGSPLQGALGELDMQRQEAGCGTGFAHPEVTARVRDELAERREQLLEQPDRARHAAASLLVILARKLAPSAEHVPVPPGLSVEFPLHPDAELSEASWANGEVTAVWDIDGSNVERVLDQYLQWLQETRTGGWEVPTGGGEIEQGDDGPVGAASFELSGYGTTGEVLIETGDRVDHTRVTVNLTIP